MDKQILEKRKTYTNIVKKGLSAFACALQHRRYDDVSVCVKTIIVETVY